MVRGGSQGMGLLVVYLSPLFETIKINYMPESSTAKVVGDVFQQAYNQAIDHAMLTVLQHSKYGDKAVTKVLDSIIRSLKNLKTFDIEPEDKEHDNGLEETMIYHEREARIKD